MGTRKGGDSREQERKEKGEKKTEFKEGGGRQGAVMVWRLPRKHGWKRLSWLSNLVLFGD